MFKSKIINWTLGIFGGLVVFGMILPKPPKSEASTTTATSPATAEAPAPELPKVQVAKEPESPWTYENDEDEMGRKRAFAAVTSTNTLDFGFPYQGEQHASITLRKNQSGLNVIFRIQKGQFICDISDGCLLNVKFDDGPLTRYSAEGPSDHKTTVLFIQSESRFVNALRKAKQVRIEATFYQEGNRTLVFDVAGLKWQ